MDVKTALGALWLLATGRSVFEEDELDFDIKQRDIEHDLSLPAAGYAPLEREE